MKNDPIILKTISAIGEDTKFTRLATLTMFIHSLVFTYLIIYYAQYFIENERVRSIITGLIDSIDLSWPVLTAVIILWVIIAFGYRIMPSIWEPAMIIYHHEWRKQWTLSLTKWINHFFQIFEFRSATWLFESSVLIFAVVRFAAFWFLDNPFIYALLIIRTLVTIFVAVFFPYTRYAIVLNNMKFIEAMKYSFQLTLRHFPLTFKYVLLTWVLSVRMIINVVLLIGLPLLFVWLWIQFGLDSNVTLQTIFIIVVIGLIIFVTYIEWLIEAFFITCRQHVWNEVQEREEDTSLVK